MRSGWTARSHAALRRAPIGGGARAVATLVHVAPDAEAALDGACAALAATVGEAGASAWNGMLVARILAADGAALRARGDRRVAGAAGARPLPRVWLC